MINIIDKFDPWLFLLSQIKARTAYLIRKNLVDSMVKDIIGVQPMTGPESQIFTLRQRYKDLI